MIRFLLYHVLIYYLSIYCIWKVFFKKSSEVVIWFYDCFVTKCSCLGSINLFLAIYIIGSFGINTKESERLHNPYLYPYLVSTRHFSALKKFQDFSRILYKIPGIIFFFFNVASTYNWVSVYTLYITSTPFCLHYPKVCIPPLQPPLMTCITLKGRSW